MSNDELREVFNDTDGERRREFWTDGEWIKVGRDVDDHDLCLTFRYDDDYYEKFRRGDHPFKITIEDDRGSDNKYLVDCDGFGQYRFFQGRRLVLEVNDHELGTIRAVYRKARMFRESEYDWQDIARTYVQGLFPSQHMLEIVEFDFSEARKTASVRVGHGYETPNVNETFMEMVKEAEHTTWNGVYHDMDECEGFRYSFSVDAHGVKNDQ